MATSGNHGTLPTATCVTYHTELGKSNEGPACKLNRAITCTPINEVEALREGNMIKKNKQYNFATLVPFI